MDNQIFVKEDMSEASIYRGTGNIVEPEPLFCGFRELQLDCKGVT